LVGERKRRAIQVRVSSAKSSPLVQGPLLGRLGRLFASQPRANARDAWDAPDEVAESSDDSGTPGTGQSKSAEQLPNHLGTIGTTLNPSAYREKSSVHRERLLPLYAKDIDQGVPSVPSQDLVSESEPTVPTAPRRQPHFTEGGVLVIPFDSDPKYHWWRGGQTIAETRAELSLNLKPNNNP
jgi:hypothetical protein